MTNDQGLTEDGGRVTDLELQPPPAASNQQPATNQQPPEIEGDVLLYVGTSFLVGVPARKLTAFEFQQFDIQTQWEIVTSELYEWAQSEPQPEAEQEA